MLATLVPVVETRDRNIQCVRGRVGSYYLCSPPPACTIISVTRQGDKVHTPTHTHTHTHMLDKRNFWIGSRGSGQPWQYYADARRIRIRSCEHTEPDWPQPGAYFALVFRGAFSPTGCDESSLRAIVRREAFERLMVTRSWGTHHHASLMYLANCNDTERLDIVRRMQAYLGSVVDHIRCTVDLELQGLESVVIPRFRSATCRGIEYSIWEMIDEGFDIPALLSTRSIPDFKAERAPGVSAIDHYYRIARRDQRRRRRLGGMCTELRAWLQNQRDHRSALRRSQRAGLLHSFVTNTKNTYGDIFDPLPKFVLFAVDNWLRYQAGLFKRPRESLFSDSDSDLGDEPDSNEALSRREVPDRFCLSQLVPHKEMHVTDNGWLYDSFSLTVADELALI